MKYVILILALFVLYCDVPAQTQYYEIEYPLNQSGSTAEYLIFIALADDTTNIPFYDSLFTFPDSQWSQYLLYKLGHDSLYALDTSSAIVEYYPTVGNTERYMAIAFFAKSPDGWYSDMATTPLILVPPYNKPETINAGLIIVTRKLKWQ